MDIGLGARVDDSNSFMRKSSSMNGDKSWIGASNCGKEGRSVSGLGFDGV